MNAILLGLLRHFLTVAGGALVANGTTSASDWEAIVGGIMAVVGILASVIKNKKTSAVAPSTDVA